MVQSTDSSAYLNFGYRSGTQVGICNLTWDFPELVSFINLCLRRAFPGKSWASICVSHNSFAKLHSDSRNLYGSENHVLSLGQHVGGLLWLEGALEQPAPPPSSQSVDCSGGLVNIHEKPFSFNPRLLHGSSEWVGDRWVLIAYTPQVFQSASSEDLLQLQSLSFPFPGAETTSSAALSPSPSPVPLASDTKLFLDLCCGSSAPFSTAVRALGIPCLAVDPLFGEGLDLLHDETFDRLLALAHNGVFKLAHASPPCGEFSLVKLREDGGPRAIRTPDEPYGRSDLTDAESERLRTSFSLATRCISLLLAVFESGGQTCLEHPRNSMLWLLKEAQFYLNSVAADVVVTSACQWQQDWFKHWAFATSLRSLQSLAGVCPHGKDAHAQIWGVKDETGQHLSRLTATYPESLASAFAQHVLPLFTPLPDANFVVLQECMQLLPRKPMSASFPCATQDGGGIFSMPDWSSPQPGKDDVLREVRHKLHAKLLQLRAPQRLREHVANNTNSPLFTSEEVFELRAIWDAVLAPSSGLDWQVSVGQPYSLSALEAVASFISDKDVSLWPCLHDGVPTGYRRNIPLSGVLIPLESNDFDPPPLQHCTGNWSEAEKDPDLFRELIEQEVAAGFLEEVGSLETAQSRWPNLTAVGKCNIVKHPTKAPRLIMDSSISNTNAGCYIPERYMMPSLQDIRASWPLRGDDTDFLAFAMDIKGAHKTIRIHPDEWGLNMLQLASTCFAYKCCPFGAAFSAFWWTRLSAFFIRFLHLLIFLKHSLCAYVDDFYMVQPCEVAALTSSMILSVCQCVNIPLSWAKLQFGARVVWIGWSFNLRSHSFHLPYEKLEKLRAMLSALLKGDFTTRHELEIVAGYLQWVFQMHKLLKPWLSCLYDDMRRPVATSYSVEPSQWIELISCISDDLLVQRQLPGAALPLGGRLLSVKHQALRSKADLRRVGVSPKRIWLRITNPASSKRRLSHQSKVFLRYWQQWAQMPFFSRPLAMPPRWLPDAFAADACASGNKIGIGGFIKMGDAPAVWFSEVFSLRALQKLISDLPSVAQEAITCWETLAQMGLVLLLASCFPGGRLKICVPSWCDNTGAESTSNKLFCTSLPLAFFAQKLSLLSWHTGISLDVHHVAGFENTIADHLSRWMEGEELPSGFSLDDRFRLSWEMLWHFKPDVRIWPESHGLLWQPQSFAFS